jgi:hypothetical protein
MYDDDIMVVMQEAQNRDTKEYWAVICWGDRAVMTIWRTRASRHPRCMMVRIGDVGRF